MIYRYKTTGFGKKCDESMIHVNKKHGFSLKITILKIRKTMSKTINKNIENISLIVSYMFNLDFWSTQCLTTCIKDILRTFYVQSSFSFLSFCTFSHMVFCDTMSFSGSHIEFPIKKKNDIPESFSFKMVKWFREQNLKTFFFHMCHLDICST